MKKGFFFPMKWKFLMVILAIPLLAGITFYMTATKLFKEDKTAYIYSHAQQEALKIGNSFQSLFFDLENLFVTLVNEKKYPDQYLKFLTHKYSILGIHLFKNKKKLFSLGENLEERSLEKEGESYAISKHGEDDGLFYLELKKRAGSNEYYIQYVIQNPDFYNSLNETRSFSAFIFKDNGAIFLKNNNDFEQDIFSSYGKEISQLKEQKIKAITINKAHGEKEYLSSLTKVEAGAETYYLLLLQDHQTAFSAIGLFKAKSSLILVFILSLAAIIAIFFANKLTFNLSLLKDAAKNLSKENFDKELIVSSNDEVGVLAITFDHMRLNIKELMEKIREYNLFLEEKVKERTAELNEALQLQKAMVDNLDQGFLMFKEGGKILPVYSTASKEMFKEISGETTFGEVLDGNSEKSEELNQYFDLMLSDELPFQDIVNFAPKEFINDKGKIIHLQYTPVKGNQGETEYVVVVASDKTTEVQALKDAQREKDHARAIIHFVTEKRKFISLLENYKNKRQEFSRKVPSLDQFRIYIHTLKGNVKVYHLEELGEYLHEQETALERHSKLGAEKVKEIFGSIDLFFNKELSKYSVMLGFETLENMSKTKEINVKEIKNFHDTLKNSSNPQLQKTFEEAFLHEEIDNLLPNFENEAQSIAAKLGKNIYPIKIINAKIKVPLEWEEIFTSLTHLIRNSLDHGIETPEARRKNSKDEKGTLQFEFKSNSESLQILFSDNGRGISIHKARKKLGLNESAPAKEVLRMIFEAGFSTADKVTEISGRGVGLGSIKEVVSKFGGEVEIQTEESKGTTLTITVPWEREKELSQAV